jgi:hypothetical protein
LDLPDFYRIFHPTKVHGTFFKIDHLLGHKESLNKYKKIEITPCMLSDHKAIKLNLNNESNSRKYANNWRLSNTLLKDQWIIRD